MLILILIPVFNIPRSQTKTVCSTIDQKFQINHKNYKTNKKKRRKLIERKHC